MKSLSELSLEELFMIAKKPIKEDEYKKLPPARRFIMSDGLEDGNYKIPAILIYDRYQKWATAYKTKAVSQANFFKEFAKYFNKVRTATGMAYLLSPKGFDLSPQYLVMLNEKHTTKTNVKRNSDGNKKSKKVTKET